MAKSRMGWCAFAVAAGAMASLPAKASSTEMLKQMDATAPKYNSPECTEVREASVRVGPNGVPTFVYHHPGGGPAIPPGAAYAMGGIAILMIIGAANEEAKRDAAFADILVERCGPDTFVPYFTRKAEKSDDVSQAWLGRFYAHRQDWPQAIRWYQAAADDGNAAAETGLATIYANGSGVPQDRARAAELYQKAAKRGFVEAQTKLGQMYVADQNYAQAIPLLREAASRRSAAAAFQLGEFYEQGIGVACSDRAAFGWFSIASLNGHPDGAARRGAVAARLKPDTLSDLIRQVEKCFYGRSCNF